MLATAVRKRNVLCAMSLKTITMCPNSPLGLASPVGISVLRPLSFSLFIFTCCYFPLASVSIHAGVEPTV